MKPDKKEIEKRFVEDFLKTYFGQIPGELIPGESPDFVLEEHDRKIGIEVTQLCRSMHDGNSSIQAQDSWHKKIITTLNQMYKTSYRIYVCFNENSTIARKISDSLCKEIVSCVKNRLKKDCPGNGESLTINKDSFDRSRDALVYISICNAIEGAVPGFQMIKASSIDPINIENVHLAIRKKQQLLPGYRKCDEMWLVCTIDFFDAAMDQDIPDNLNICVPDSSFDKIFLYKTIFQTIVPIK